MGSEVLSISLPSTTSVGEALSELLGKAMILSTELQDGVHKGLPEVAEFQVKVWILSERLDDWRVELWRSGVSNQHLWRNLRVAQDILTNLQKNLRSYLERWNRSAIPTLMHLLFVVNNILETGDARTQLQAGMAPDPISPRLSHGRDRIDLPVAGSSLETQDGPDDREGPSAVTIPRDLGMGLMEKAMLFTTQVQNRCYRRSAELAEFQKKVWLLSENDVQCGIRLGERPNSKHGHFLRALKVFETILENELRYIRNSSFRLRRRAFPRQLLYVLNEILKIVGIIARHNPPPLYFGPDGNYVPISRTIQEVREGLQDETAPNVLTVYGGPGCGKSSLVRYLAVSYQQKMRRVEAITPAIPSPQTVHFSDGVYFFTCGYRASQKVRQLQLEILNCLGSAAQPDDLTDAGKQEGGYVALSSYKRSMSSLLAQRNALIIFDDVWEPEAVKELVVPSMRVKYLITSQIKDICRLIRGPRATIGIQMPTLTEARQILSNFTEGLPRKGELPNSLEVNFCLFFIDKCLLSPYYARSHSILCKVYLFSKIGNVISWSMVIHDLAFSMLKKQLEFG